MVSNKISQEKRRRIAELRSEGVSISQTAKKVEVSRPTVRKYSDFQENDTENSTETTSEPDNSPDKLIKSHNNENEVSQMTENDNEEVSDSYENICGNCGEKFDGSPNTCPGCNSALNYDNTIEL